MRVDLCNVCGLASTSISKIQLRHVCYDSQLLYTAVDNLVIVRKHLPRGQLPRKMDWVRANGDQTGANSLNCDWCVHFLLGAIFHHQHRVVLLQDQLSV